MGWSSSQEAGYLVLSIVVIAAVLVIAIPMIWNLTIGLIRERRPLSRTWWSQQDRSETIQGWEHPTRPRWKSPAERGEV